MEFNDLIKILNEGALKAPFDNKRRVIAPPSKNFNSQNSLFYRNQNVAAHGGFLGDRLNPKEITSVFKLPKKKLKKRS